MQRVYLILAILGAIAPYFFFFQFINDFGIDVPQFITQLFATPPAAGFTVDLLITSGVFWLWMQQNRSAAAINPIPFVLVNLSIGLSCALPLYLYFLEKKKA